MVNAEEFAKFYNCDETETQKKAKIQNNDINNGL
jgi:hypothetical protein